MFRFEDLSWIPFLWLLPILWLIGFFFIKRKRKLIQTIWNQKTFSFLTHSLSTRKREWKRILECFVLFFFILALSRPQWGKSLQKVTHHGIELFILFDISKSMLAEDIKPSRLEFSKREIIRFLDFSRGDKIGLIAFAGSSVLLSPMTTDYSALKMYVKSLEINSISTQGTDFKGAFLDAEKAFKRGGIEESENDIVTRALLIVSDGEDNEKGALEIAKNFKTQGIYIFSLLFGTKRGGVIPFRNSFGEIEGYQKDSKGKVVLTRAKGDFLKNMALENGGSFYHVSYGSSSIRNIREDIEALQKTEFEDSLRIDYRERYQILLLLGVLLAFIELILGDKRHFKNIIWKGRF